MERKGGVDQSTASFTEPMRPSTSHNAYMATVRQREGTGEKGKEEEEEDQSDDEVGHLVYTLLPPLPYIL